MQSNTMAVRRLMSGHDDDINPSHYRSGSIECIDSIKASMSSEAFHGYLKGSVMKYLWRYEDKHSDEQGGVVTDLEKCRWFLNRLIDENKN